MALKLADAVVEISADRSKFDASVSSVMSAASRIPSFPIRIVAEGKGLSDIHAHIGGFKIGVEEAASSLDKLFEAAGRESNFEGLVSHLSMADTLIQQVSGGTKSLVTVIANDLSKAFTGVGLAVNGTILGIAALKVAVDATGNAIDKLWESSERTAKSIEAFRNAPEARRQADMHGYAMPHGEAGDARKRQIAVIKQMEELAQQDKKDRALIDSINADPSKTLNRIAGQHPALSGSAVADAIFGGIADHKAGDLAKAYNEAAQRAEAFNETMRNLDFDLEQARRDELNAAEKAAKSEMDRAESKHMRDVVRREKEDFDLQDAQRRHDAKMQKEADDLKEWLRKEEDRARKDAARRGGFLAKEEGLFPPPLIDKAPHGLLPMPEMPRADREAIERPQRSFAPHGVLGDIASVRDTMQNAISAGHEAREQIELAKKAQEQRDKMVEAQKETTKGIDITNKRLERIGGFA